MKDSAGLCSDRLFPIYEPANAQAGIGWGYFWGYFFGVATQ